MREQYMRTGEGFLLVYSIDSRQTFDEMESFHSQILRVKDVDTFPMVMVGNKCDLPADLRQVSLQAGNDLAKRLECNFMETSAKLKTNVDEAFYQLVRLIRKRRKEAIKYSGPSRKPTKPKCTLL